MISRRAQAMATRRRLSTVPKAAPKQDIIGHAREVIRAEAEAIAQLAGRLNGAFARAVEMVLSCPGRVVVTGMGKPGFIAQKISATLSSTGTPSLYLHPAEALLNASRRADLLVVGRHTDPRAAEGRLGPVTHAVLHHARCPVAVVPHTG